MKKSHVKLSKETSRPFLNSIKRSLIYDIFDFAGKEKLVDNFITKIKSKKLFILAKSYARQIKNITFQSSTKLTNECGNPIISFVNNLEDIDFSYFFINNSYFFQYINNLHLTSASLSDNKGQISQFLSKNNHNNLSTLTVDSISFISDWKWMFVCSEDLWMRDSNTKKQIYGSFVMPICSKIENLTINIDELKYENCFLSFNENLGELRISHGNEDYEYCRELKMIPLQNFFPNLKKLSGFRLEDIAESSWKSNSIYIVKNNWLKYLSLESISLELYRFYSSHDEISDIMLNCMLLEEINFHNIREFGIISEREVSNDFLSKLIKIIVSKAKDLQHLTLDFLLEKHACSAVLVKELILPKLKKLSIVRSNVLTKDIIDFLNSKENSVKDIEVLDLSNNKHNLFPDSLKSKLLGRDKLQIIFKRNKHK